VPVEAFWKLKTDSRSDFLRTNKYISSNRRVYRMKAFLQYINRGEKETVMRRLPRYQPNTGQSEPLSRT
jgi:hypothetical protein